MHINFIHSILYTVSLCNYFYAQYFYAQYFYAQYFYARYFPTHSIAVFSTPEGTVQHQRTHARTHARTQLPDVTVFALSSCSVLFSCTPTFFHCRYLKLIFLCAPRQQNYRKNRVHTKGSTVACLNYSKSETFL